MFRVKHLFRSRQCVTTNSLRYLLNKKIKLIVGYYFGFQTTNDSGQFCGQHMFACILRSFDKHLSFKRFTRTIIDAWEEFVYLF